MCVLYLLVINHLPIVLMGLRYWYSSQCCRECNGLFM